MTRLGRLACMISLPLLSCDQSGFYARLGYQQASYSNEVGILFIADNSSSMFEENTVLRDNFDRFITDLVEAQRTEAALPHSGLDDAVAATLYYVGNFSRFIDFRLGMTTTEVIGAPTAGQSGTLVLDTVLDAETPELEAEFAALTDWVIYHPAQVGVEQGLEAIRLNVCQGLADPSDFDQTLRDDLKVGCCDVPEERWGATAGLYRPGAPLAVVLVSDEGDDTDMAEYPASWCPGGPGTAPEPVGELSLDDYLDFFDAAGVRVVVSVIGPTIPDEGEEGVLCNPSNSPYKRIRRYADLVERTGGILAPICNPAAPTEPNPDFATTLEDIGRLVSGLQNRFRLESAPDPSSIVCLVDDTLVAEDPENGWAYVRQGDGHFIEFRGEAVPSYEANVEIYYRPIDGDDPRSLPF